MRFTTNEQNTIDGSRIPALFTWTTGQLLHRMSIPGNVNYQYNEFIDSNTWYTIEYIQEFKNNMWKFEIKRDGQIVNEVELQQEPAPYENVKVFISDNLNLFNPSNAVICDFTYINYSEA